MTRIKSSRLDDRLSRNNVRKQGEYLAIGSVQIDGRIECALSAGWQNRQIDQVFLTSRFQSSGQDFVARRRLGQRVGVFFGPYLAP